MSLHFQSICSSGGNCLALWSSKTRVLIDCGLSSIKRTRHALTTLFGHISSQRNEPDLAVGETFELFEKAGMKLT